MSLAKVKAAGNTVLNQQYNFLDLEAGEGILYYRLRQVDKDGKEYYFKIVSLELAPEETFEIEFFPNPAKDRLWLRGKQTESVKSISIYDAKAVKLFECQGFQPELNLESLPAGIYLFEAVSGSGLIRKKLLLDNN